MIKVKKLFFKDLASREYDEKQVLLFKSHYEKDCDFVRASVYWMIRSSAVDDIVQEAFLKAWKSFSKFNNESSFRTWIYRIAMNVTYDYLKKEKKSKSEPYSDSEGKSSQVELKDLIDKALFQLSPEQREVFILHYKLEYKQSEIAELLKVPEGTVKSRLHKARLIFTDYVKSNGGHYE